MSHSVVNVTTAKRIHQNYDNRRDFGSHPKQLFYPLLTSWCTDANEIEQNDWVNFFEKVCS